MMVPADMPDVSDDNEETDMSMTKQG